MSEGADRRRHRRDAQRVLRADGRDDLQVRRHARQVHGRRHHGALGRARARTPTTPSARVQCALEQMEVLGQFNRKRVERGAAARSPSASASTPGRSSPATSAARRRSRYTVIGDTANTSARASAASRSRARSSSARHARAPRHPLRGRGAPARAPEGQGEAAPHLQRQAREAERGRQGRLNSGGRSGSPRDPLCRCSSTQVLRRGLDSRAFR